MNRRQFLAALSLSCAGFLLSDEVRSPAPSLAAKLALGEADKYWLFSLPWLKMVARAEGTAHLGEKGYRTIFGYRYFDSYADHPRQGFLIPSDSLKRTSDAAGMYQFLSSTYDKTVERYPDVLLEGEEYFS